MSEWWSALSLVAKIFWALAIPFSLAFIFQLITTFMGMDVDADLDVDAEIEADTGAGFQFFTLKNLIAFFTIFSWTGLACLDAGLSIGLTVIIALIAGLIMMTIMSAIVYFMGKLSYDGSLKLENAIGLVGEVYLTIPANQQGLGKVQIKIQGALRDLEAMTSDSQELRTGCLIVVRSVTPNNILIVTANT